MARKEFTGNITPKDLKDRFIQDNAEFLMSELRAVLHGESDFSCQSGKALDLSLKILTDLISKASSIDSERATTTKGVVTLLGEGKITVEEATELLKVIEKQIIVSERETMSDLKKKMMSLMAKNSGLPKTEEKEPKPEVPTEPKSTDIRSSLRALIEDQILEYLKVFVKELNKDPDIIKYAIKHCDSEYSLHWSVIANNIEFKFPENKVERQKLMGFRRTRTILKKFIQLKEIGWRVVEIEKDDDPGEITVFFNISEVSARINVDNLIKDKQW